MLLGRIKNSSWKVERDSSRHRSRCTQNQKCLRYRTSVLMRPPRRDADFGWRSGGRLASWARSENTGYIWSLGRKVLHPHSPFPTPHPHRKQSYPKLTLLVAIASKAFKHWVDCANIFNTFSRFIQVIALIFPSSIIIGEISFSHNLCTQKSWVRETQTTVRWRVMRERSWQNRVLHSRSKFMLPVCRIPTRTQTTSAATGH